MTRIKNSQENILFIIIFTILGFLALQVPFTQIIGSSIKFSLFDFFGPIASGFIGTIPGVIAVLLMQLINFLAHGAKVVDVSVILKFFPVLFAVIYFSRKTKFNFVLPILAIIAFNLHPIGRSAWQYSLYWLIPMACYFYQDKSLIARSLGTTFISHAVGSNLWLYFFTLSKGVWLSLIPVVFMERAVFAIGIGVTYLVFNNVLDYLINKKIINLNFHIDRRYAWHKSPA